MSSAVLRLLRAGDVDEVLRDLDEEAAARRATGTAGWRVAIWRAQQALLVGVYEWRDRRERAHRRELHPWLALRLAARSVRHAPGVPLAAALTLGIGFGAAAAIYGVYVGFDRPIPVADGENVLRIRVLDGRGRGVPTTLEELDILRRSAESFAGLEAYATRSVTVRAADSRPRRARAAAITAGLFELLGIEPSLGRVPAAAQEQGLLLSDELRGERTVMREAGLGDALQLDGVEHHVVGILPAGQRFPFNEELWVLLETQRLDTDVEIVARLHPGITRERASREVSRLLEGRRSAQGVGQPEVRAEVVGFTEKRGEAGELAALATLLALVVSLVLVSCSNASNLLLGRAMSRAGQLAVHSALGAGPAQLLAQMFAEALLISLTGAAFGLATAAVAIRYIESTLHGHWGYYWMEVRFDPAVVLFTLGLAVVAGSASGLLPALRLRRTDLGEALKAAGVVGVGRGRLSTLLLNTQVALSCLALIIAMLTAGTLQRSRVAPGYPAEEVHLTGITLDGPAYAEADRRTAFREALLADLEADAAVRSVALASAVPGLGSSPGRLEVEGRPLDPEARPVSVPTLAVSDGYFELFDVRPVAGRLWREVVEQDSTVLVSESFVREHLPASDVLGQRIRLRGPGGEHWLQIIGVVADLPIYRGERRTSLVRAYVRFEAADPASFQVLFRPAPGASAAAVVERAIVALDPEIAPTGIFGQGTTSSIADVLAYVQRLFRTVGLLAILGGVGAAMVALIGLYGAMSFEVQKRVPEIGVRLALGASRAAIGRHFVRLGLRAVAPGLAIGFLMSASMSPLLGVLIGGMEPRDPVIYLGVLFAFLAVAVAATVVPGRRAARLDPVSVLKAA